eukprot:TRINITY_DN5023_c0_g1_i1.p2 TRINITY_DN5023_c0_g1~~TRINITY_DN5023_c0_g1_i1.p2  ORF type:complete len:150 (-),score=28.85 TRINITY_DN5023_c0_g1_i1:257-706(-)
MAKFAFSRIVQTVERYTSGQGALIDNTYFGHILDRVLREVLGVETAREMHLLSFNCVYRRILNHPADVLVGLLADASRVEEGVVRFTYGLFDPETGKCHAYGHKMVERLVKVGGKYVTCQDVKALRAQCEMVTQGVHVPSVQGSNASKL